MKEYDLHSHTTASDGTFTPKELIERAKKNGLKGIAITDHDTVDGLKEGEKISKELNIEFIPGIEFSCTLGDRDVHILGYFIDYNSKELLEELKKLEENRNERNKEILNKLRNYKIRISEDELKEEAKGKIISKAHIANVMVKKGYVYTRGAAFKEYLGNKGVAYIKRKNFPPEKGIDLVKKAGGIPVLAHPKLISTNENEIKALIEKLVSLGLEGIEAEYGSFQKEDMIKYSELSKELNLFITGGSDFHGLNREGVDLGDGGIDEDKFLKLKNRKK